MDIEEETNRIPLLLLIPIFAVIVIAILVFGFKRDNPGIADPPEDMNSDEIVNEGGSLSQYFEEKSGNKETTLRVTGSQNKEKTCILNGKIVKEGTVVSGEICVSSDETQ